MEPLLVFALAVLFFHTSEFILACIYMRETLAISSLLITKPYALAMCLGLLENLVETTFFARLKQRLTAKRQFQHKIQKSRNPKDVLVSHGIYRYIRHPGYLGWFIWVLGTQILLANPVCTVLFAVLVWSFFKARIKYEEQLLLEHFGQEYVEYAQRTPTWIPFIP